MSIKRSYKTYKFRLYPTKQQEEKMFLTLDKCRFVYNYMLEELNKDENSFNRFKLQAKIPKLKEKHPELKDVYSSVLQYMVYRLFSNLNALSRSKKHGRKVGKLRYKNKESYGNLVETKIAYVVTSMKL